MIFEEFDRLAPDLTLSEIISARRRGRLKINQEPRKTGGFKNSEVIAAKLRELREALTGKTIPKPPVTHMNRSVLLRRITEFDARLDRIIHGDSDAGGAVKERKVTEFALLPALAGGVLGSGLGSKLSGKKYNAATGKWEDEHGNETSAPGVSSAVGGVAGAGAGYGASKLHGSVMSGYGGAGGVKEAYRNVARNVTAQGGQAVTNAIAPSFAEGADLLKKLRGKGAAALRRVFGANAPKNFIEFEERIDAIIFSEKKKLEPAGNRSGRPTTEFVAQADDEKKRGVLKPYLAGLLTVPAIGAAAAAAGPGRHMLAGAAEAIRRRRYGFAKGSNIPASKVAEYMRMLHLGQIKA